MGAHPWSYFVPYQENIQAALETLRQEEFRAGRFYQPDEVRPGFLSRIFGRSPGKPRPPTSIREAIKNTDATGTRSILTWSEFPTALTSVWCPPSRHLSCGVCWARTNLRERKSSGARNYSSRLKAGMVFTS